MSVNSISKEKLSVNSNNKQWLCQETALINSGYDSKQQ